MSENVGASTCRNPKGLHGLYRDKKKKKKKELCYCMPHSCDIALYIYFLCNIYLASGLAYILATFCI
jgi:ferredoxin-thioredoxin reductase catalytic subunit